MHVTGTVTSLPVSGRHAECRGTATVTGPGAGHDRRRSGVTVLLTVVGPIFHEIHAEGHLDAG